MADPLFYDFLVEHANFPAPNCRFSLAASSTDLSVLEVGRLDNRWKARSAVPDNNLANKLCDGLRAALGDMTVTEDIRNALSGRFLPALLEHPVLGEDVKWATNPDEAHSKRLLDAGVFLAATGCLSRYGQFRLAVLAEQKAEVARSRSIVDFHVLVNNQLVALVEAKSPTVMNRLRQSLPDHSFRIRWTPGSKHLVSLVFSKAALYLGLRQREWLFLTCHNYWIVIRLVRQDNAPPFLAFSPLITMVESSVPFRAFLGAIISTVEERAIEASVFNVLQGPDEALDEEGYLADPEPLDDYDDKSGTYRGRAAQGPGGQPPRRPATRAHPAQE